MKKRIQVSLNPILVEWAKDMMDRRGFDSLSEFLEYLIRDEQDRRQSPGKTPTAPDAWPGRPASTDSLNDAGPTPHRRKHRK